MQNICTWKKVYFTYIWLLDGMGIAVYSKHLISDMFKLFFIKPDCLLKNEWYRHVEPLRSVKNKKELALDCYRLQQYLQRHPVDIVSLQCPARYIIS
jgi:hypothetical protein